MKEKLKKVEQFSISPFVLAKDVFYQTPNIPKKLDKFNNYVQQNFKVNDDKVSPVLFLN